MKTINEIPLKNWTIFASIFILGVVLTLGFSGLLHDLEQKEMAIEFVDAAQTHQLLFQNSIEAYLAGLDGLSRFYISTDAFNRSSFRTYVTSFLAANPEIQALEWIPRVSLDARTRYELAAHKDGFTDFVITERNPESELIPAAQRAEYYPVYYMEPLVGNEAALGFDLASNATRLAALEKARDTAQDVATARIQLVQESGQQYGFLVFKPVYRGGKDPGTIDLRRMYLEGFMLGVFRIGDILETSLAPISSRYTHVIVTARDNSAQPDKQLLHVLNAKRAVLSSSDSTETSQLWAKPGRFEQTVNFRVADRQWSITLVMAEPKLTFNQQISGWAVLLIGLMFTTLAALYYLSSQYNIIKTQQLVDKRTSELSRSEGLIRNVLETIGDGVITTNERGIVQSINRAAEIIFGYKADEVNGNNVTMLMPESYAADHDGYLKRYQDTHKKHIIGDGREVEGMRKDGSHFPLYLVVSEVIFEGKSIFTGLVRDITERKKSEEALLESEEQLQLALMGADLGLWDWNIQTGEVRLNERWAAMLGYSLDEIEMGFEAWANMLHPDDLPQVQQVLANHLEGGTPYYEAEHRMLAKSGEWKWIFARGKVFTRDEAGNPIRAVGTHLDITERKKSEEALREGKARLKAIVETASSGIIVIDRNGILEDFNHGAEVIFGYNSSEVIGQNVKMLMPETYASEHDGYLNNYHKTGIKKIIGIGREVVGQKKDGSTFPMNLSVNEVHLSDRTVYAGIVDDITERVAAEAKLQDYAQKLEWTNMEISDALREAEEATQAKSAFLASMSHELRTPLNSIIGFAKVLQKNKAQNLNDKDLKYLERLTVNATDLFNLINNILDISKIEAGELALDETATNLSELIRETVDQMKGHGRAGQTCIVIELPDDVAPLLTDRARLKQVLVNLIGNALKFTLQGTVTVDLEINPADRSVTKIHVRDTGIGIPADRLELIFGAFQQADIGISRKYGGTGLGLAISLRICQAMGYELFVESEEGVGSTFTVAFQNEGE